MERSSKMARTTRVKVSLGSWLITAALVIGWGTPVIASPGESKGSGGWTPASMTAAATSLQERPVPSRLEAETRNQLQVDVPAMMLGAFLGALGMVAALLSFIHWKPYGPYLLSFGAFSALYGVRLLAWTPTTWLLLDFSETFWRYLEALITYVIPIPILYYFEQYFGKGWKQSMRRLRQVFTAYVVVAILVDVATGPSTAMGPYRFFVIGIAIVIPLHMFWPGGPVSRDLKVLRAGFLVFMILAANATFISSLPWSFSAEPVGFVIFIASLGFVVADRFFRNQKELFAIGQEMETARRIQTSVLPQAAPQVDGLDLAVRYVPMKAVAGDFYDFLVVDRHRLNLLVADVSGHGVPAALIASMVKVAFSAQMERAASPREVLSEINRILCGKIKGQFVTAACVYIDMERRLARYSTAGHPPLLMWSKARGAVREIRLEGMLMGFLPEAVYTETELPIEPGDRIVAYTDGIVETTNASGEFFDKKRLVELMEQEAHLPATSFADTLLTRLSQWSGKSETFEDDLTLVVVDFLTRYTST